MMEKTNNHIAFYLRMLSGGGAERVIVNLTKGLVERGIKVDLVLNILEGPYLKQVPSEVRIINLGTPKLLKGLPKLINYLQKEQPQVLFSAMHYNNEIAIWAKHLSRVKTKVIVSERNILSVRAKNQKDREKWSPLFAKLFYPWADEIIAVSKGVAEDLVSITALNESKIKVIYNPVNTSMISEKAQEFVSHPWFESGQPPVIVSVGRLHIQKDYPTLLNAFAQVRQKMPCKLMILGQGPERENLMAIVNNLEIKNDVKFLGFRQNPYAYMAKANLLVLSSRWEGLPNVIIEALTIGIPIVSTKCAGKGAEELLVDGKYGDLVEIGDSKGMSKAIIKILSGEIKFVDSHWLNQFTLQNVTEKYVELFEM